MAPLKRMRAIAVAGMLWAGACVPYAAAAAAPTEQQVKAVFLFNFASFVEWPAAAFESAAAPFVIGLLGGDELAAHLEEAIRGERVDGRPLQLRRFSSPAALEYCHILFIDRSHEAQLPMILDALRGRHTLTVSDVDRAARRGVMIRLLNERNRIRLVVNRDEARNAGLIISSNLLRPAEIVSTDAEEAR